MNIRLHPYRLEFIFPFRIAHGLRTHTDALFLELEHEGVSAFGEATFPPYLKYTPSAAMAELSALSLDRLVDTEGLIYPTLSYHHYQQLQAPARAALDMALWSLKAKLERSSVRSLLGITELASPPRTYTIALCERQEMAQRIEAAHTLGYTMFKLKMNGINDRQMLEDFRSLCQEPFAVDANQSWTDLAKAISRAQELSQNGCTLIEQPFSIDQSSDSLLLRSAVSIPIIADESCQDIRDIGLAKDFFSGVNIKLQKCGGITPAYEMIKYARSLGLSILIGCMSESGVGCSAGEVLAPLCDWNDLDGVALIKPVPFAY